jgi:hypothetical protein
MRTEGAQPCAAKLFEMMVARDGVEPPTPGPPYCSQAVPRGSWVGKWCALCGVAPRDGLILVPEHQRFDHLCQQVSSSLTAAGLTSGDILATLPEARNRVYARRCGKKVPGTPFPGPLSKLSREATGQRRILPFPRLERPNRRDRFFLGTLQGHVVALCGEGL